MPWARVVTAPAPCAAAPGVAAGGAGGAATTALEANDAGVSPTVVGAAGEDGGTKVGCLKGTTTDVGTGRGTYTARAKTPSDTDAGDARCAAGFWRAGGADKAPQCRAPPNNGDGPAGDREGAAATTLCGVEDAAGRVDCGRKAVAGDGDFAGSRWAARLKLMPRAP